MKKILALGALMFVGTTAVAQAADAAVWRNAGFASASSPYGAIAVLSKTTANGTKGLRLFTRAPKGRTIVDAWVQCYALPSYYPYGQRSVSWSYWSNGRTERNVHRLPVPVYGGQCDIVLSAESVRSPGLVTAKLQRYH